MTDRATPTVQLELTNAQREVLWEQFVGVYADEQKSYDSSLRSMAAGGLAITVSLATALKQLPYPGTVAAALFLAALLLNLCSHVTSQLDMKVRIDCLRNQKPEGVEGNRWTLATAGLNYAAGLVLVGGGVLLTIFIGGAT